MDNGKDMMKSKVWTSTEIMKFFRASNRIKSKQTIFNAEERGDIPSAERVPRGSIRVRQWREDQIPDIGRYFGFLRAPCNQAVICNYTPKGGVLKTTMAFILGRTLALNGIKTLLIGLDIQCSLTDILLPIQECESLDESYDNYYGLYHYLYENVPLKDIIRTTSLPTLDIIPETHELNLLEKKIRSERRREYVFMDKLIPNLKEYDVVIFDNGPSWNMLIENALAASKHIISPIGCELMSYKAVGTNLSIIDEFKDAMGIDWYNLFLVPTLLEKNKLSQQIYGAYLSNFPDNLAPIPIRRAVKGQEAIALQRTPLEIDPSSGLSQDYLELIQYIWKKICIVNADLISNKKSKDFANEVKA